jgi:hypothetical protein
MRRVYYIVLIVLLLGILFSCTKRNGEEEGKLEKVPVATITFFSPAAGAVFTNGDSVNVRATAVSTAEIHGYDLSIRKAADPSGSYYFTHIHDHNDTVQINEKWKSLVIAPADLQAEITIYLDHEGHTKKERVVFRIE